MTVFALLLGLLVSAPEVSPGAPNVDEPAQSAESAADANLRKETEPPSASPKGRRSRRTVRELMPWRAGPSSFVGMPRPKQLRRRAPWVAASLGSVVGFGAGHYYAIESDQAFLFTGIDVVLSAGFLGTLTAFNQLVIRNDFRTGRSLSHGGREFGYREGMLYTASWMLGLGLVASHVWQGFSAAGSARDTNSVLDGFAFVPL